MDILWKTEDYVFSYRVAGICIRDGKVLLQTLVNEEGYAFPGGHVAFGETNEQTLIREFDEEIGASITVGELRWVAEIFMPWGGRRFHQICLFYNVELDNADIPADGTLMARESLEGRAFDIEFRWIPLDSIENILIYPTNAKDLLKRPADGVQHFVYNED